MTDPALWYAMPALTGSRIRLEPLRVEHAEDYLAAAGDPEIFRWQSPAEGALAHPSTIEDARRHIVAALAGRARGARLPYAQIAVPSGRFAGTTSFADPDPGLRAVTIGYTWLGRPWWGSGAERGGSFKELDAVRVTLVTDIRNERARAAIERLGARQEGVLRKHRRRADGSWRDTVIYAVVDDDWPAVRHGLRERL